VLEYLEKNPDLRLSGHVRCYWSLAGWAAPGAFWRVLPDGCADALFDVAAQAGGRWVGTMTRALEVSGQGRADLFGIRFAPGGLAAMAGASLQDLSDATADLGMLPLPALDGLRDALCDRATFDERCAAADAALLRALPSALPVPLAPVLSWLDACPSLPDVPALAARLGTSGRTLERRFLEGLGVRPKQHLRYLRFERARRLLPRRDLRVADIAAALEYSDEAHLIHEFRRFAGETPGAFRRALLG
jgi:AraC-like DNA-binding protein